MLKTSEHIQIFCSECQFENKIDLATVNFQTTVALSHSYRWQTNIADLECGCTYSMMVDLDRKTKLFTERIDIGKNSNTPNFGRTISEEIRDYYTVDFVI
jgi:hypothetical protein